MDQPINRREFITASTLLAAELSLGLAPSDAQVPDAPAAGLAFKTKPHKALISRPTEDGANLREGSVRWPVLRQALEAINYNGWMTIESNESISLEERNRRLDLILAGQ
jgi:hypothetical protein